MYLYIQFLFMFTRKIYYKLMNEMFFLIYFFIHLYNKKTKNKTKKICRRCKMLGFEEFVVAEFEDS